MSSDKPNIKDTRKCAVCQIDVKIGLGGEHNWRVHVHGKSHQEKQRKQEEDKRTRKLDNFFSRQPKVQSGIDKISGHANRQESGPLSESTIGTTSSAPSEATEPVLSCLHELICLIRSLPPTIPIAEPSESNPLVELSQFNISAALLVDDDDRTPWEVINRALDNAVGYNRSAEDLACFVRRGTHGMSQLCQWIACCIQVHKCDPVLFEPRIEKLCCALRLCGATYTQHLAPLLATVPESHANSDEISFMPGAASQSDDEVEVVERPPASVPGSSHSDDEVEIIEHPATFLLPTALKASQTALKKKSGCRSAKQCRGYNVQLPAGAAPCAVYPFGQHITVGSLPWSIHIDPDRIQLHALNCLKVTSNQADTCSACAVLRDDRKLAGIETRMFSGYKKGTPYAFLSVQHLISTLREKTKEISALKLEILNLTRSLSLKLTAVSDSKRILMAISQAPIPRVHVVLTVALKNGLGFNGIMQKLESARKAIYRPHSYSEEEYHQMALCSIIGGARVAYFAQQAFGLPSAKTMKRQLQVFPLRASTGYPTIEEILLNICRNFPANETLDLGSELIEVPISIMIDEIKVQSRLRWDAKTNKILGVCREHGEKRVSLDFRSMAVADALVEALTTPDEDKQVHFASEASVVAVRLLTNNSRINHARPIVVSGTCKRETAREHQDLLTTVVQILCENPLQNLTRQRIYTIESDGDSKRRRAAAALTLNFEVSRRSPIWHLLRDLPLFNYLCGRDELVANIDYAHLFKRGRNTALRAKGIVIDGVHISPSIIRKHLLNAGLDACHVQQLLFPNDKQNVPLAQGLLSALSSLGPAAPSEPPIYHESRRILRFLGLFYHHLLATYTDVQLSLFEQLKHLSALAHEALAVYTQFKGGFIPVQLYFDIATMAKAAYFSVAKAQVANPDSRFWLILLGTDALEKLFGVIRTMIGNDTNADVLQLASRAGNASVCTQVLQMHPEWDQGPKRLKLRPMEAGIVSRSYDHISPQTWQGDTCVSSVDLRTAWQQGERTAREELQSCGISVPFDEMAKKGLDILCPFQTQVVVLIDGLGRDERDEDEDETDLPSSTSNALSSTEQGGLVPTAEELEPDVEDLAGADPITNLPDEGNIIHNAFIDIGNGKRQHKGTILKICSSPLTIKDSKDRLKRVCGLSSFNSTTPTGLSVASLDINDDDGKSLIMVEDPIATLLRCTSLVFLALGAVVELKVGGARVSSIATQTLHEPNVRVCIQVLKLVPLMTENDDATWEWTGRYESLSVSGQTVSRELEGRWTDTINPTVTSSTQPERQGEQTYQMSSDTLCSIAALLFERIRLANEVGKLPEVPSTETYPYRLKTGEACFQCKTEGEEQANYQDRFRCRYCPALPLDRNPSLVEHMGGHILFDDAVNVASDPCGLCLSTGSVCSIRLTKGSKAGIAIIDQVNSRCPNLYKMGLKAARQSSANSPCTNHPLACPLCPPSSEAVWLYNFKSHMEQIHPQANIKNYEHLNYEISKEERAAMQTRFVAKPRNNILKQTKGAPSRILAVSDKHIASVVIQQRSFALRDLPDLPEPGTSMSQADDMRLEDGLRASISVPSKRNYDTSEIETHLEGSSTDIAVPESCQGASMLSTTSSDQRGTDGKQCHEKDEGNSGHDTQSDIRPEGYGDDSDSLRASHNSQPIAHAYSLRSSFEPQEPTASGSRMDVDTYCSCRGPESGKMVECDGPDCARNWFHFECVGLVDEPKGDWFCDECTVAVRGKKRARRK